MRTEGDNPQNYFNALMLELTVKTEKLKHPPSLGDIYALGTVFPWIFSACVLFFDQSQTSVWIGIVTT